MKVSICPFLLPENVSKIARWVANSVHPDQTPCSVASDHSQSTLFAQACPNT